MHGPVGFAFPLPARRYPRPKIFDTPVATGSSQELLGIRGQTGDELSRFTGGMVRQSPFAFDQDQALELGPFLIWVHRVEVFGGCSGPAATEFDATVALFDGLVVGVGQMHEFAFLFTPKHLLDIIMQWDLVPFSRQCRVSAPLGQQLHNRFLAAYGIDRQRYSRTLPASPIVREWRLSHSPLHPLLSAPAQHDWPQPRH